MITPSFIFGIVIAVAVGVTGALGWSYYKGNQACVASYQYKILQARVKNQEIALAYYKSASENAAILAENSKLAESISASKAKELEDEIKLLRSDGSVIITAEFLRKLDGIRQQSVSKNSRSALKRLSKGNEFKALDAPGLQKLLVDFALNENHNVRAILTARKYHKRIQEIYNSKQVLTVQ